MLFTFEDQETGELRSLIAPNEAVARLQLGGIWTDVERTAAWQPCEIANLPDLVREAQTAEDKARREMNAANPMGQGITTPEALARFTAAQEKYHKRRAHREELMRLMASPGQ
jgi:hypothetical protein